MQIRSQNIPRRPLAVRATSSLRTEKASRATEMPIDFFTLSGLVPSRITPIPAFRYRGVKIADVSGVSTRITGTEANARITEGYHQLDQAFSNYLGEPAVANWLTFGKYASREAGVQIADLENAFGAMDFQMEAIKDLGAGLGELQRLTQSIKAFKSEFIHYQKQLLKSGDFLSLKSQFRFTSSMTGQLRKLHDALVAGNVGVYEHIAPAFDLFMKSESAGRDGVEALRKAGWGQGTQDPQGFVLEAFQLYQQARALTVRVNDPALTSEERLETMAKRQALIGRANLLLVTNEQWTIVQSQAIFGDADIQRLTEAMAGTMTIVDAMGKHELLPNGGNWTDFATRMGFREVPRGTVSEAITIKDERGQKHDYVPQNFEKREGTIYTYFDQNLSESRSRQLITSRPAPVSER